MAIIGSNKEAFRKSRKNILPPFDDEGWKPSAGVDLNSVTIDGYQIGFTGARYSGFTYDVDNYYAGKTVSLSVGMLKDVNSGELPAVVLRYYISGTLTQSVIYPATTGLKRENITIPANADNIHILIEIKGAYTYFKNIQLEVGSVATDFEERFEVAKVAEKGIRFDGIDDYIDCGSPSSLATTGDLTISTFVKVNEVTGGIIVKGDSGGWASNEYGIRNSGDSFRFFVCDINNTDLNVVLYTPPRNKWVHIVAIADKKEGLLKVFENGRLAVSGDYTVTMKDKGRSLYIGKGYVTTFFLGSIRDLRIYNKAMTDQEVVQLYSGEILNDGLVAEYDFDKQDIASNTVKDTSGKNNDGVIKGASYIKKESHRIPRTKNLVPPLSEWNYLGGARYEDGIAILDGNSARIESPLIDVKHLSTGMRISGEFFAYEPSYLTSPSNPDGDKFGLYMNTSYYNENMEGVPNSGGHIGNGNATIVGKVKEWSSRYHWSFSYSKETRYVRVRIQHHSAYSPPLTKVRNVMCAYIQENVDFVEYQSSPKLAKTSWKKRIPYKNHPFVFHREGTALDEIGNTVGFNQPRVSKDGVLVDDGTVNIIEERKQKFQDGWFRNFGSVATVEQGIEVEEWNTKEATRIRTSGGTSAIKYYGSLVVPSVVDQLYSMSVNLKNIGEYPIVFSNNLGKYTTIQPNEIGRFTLDSSTGNGGSNFQMMFSTLSENISLPLDFIVWRPQAEERPSSTSFTPDKRGRETLYISRASDLMDRERGSIEFEYTPISGEGVSHGVTTGLHDLVCYGGGGFILRRGYTGANKIEFYSVNDSNGSLSEKRVAFNWKNGEIIKCRIAWDKSANKTTLTVNGSTLAESPYLKIPSSNDMFIGGRDGDNFGRGNAIYKNLIVRNRWGETVFRL